MRLNFTSQASLEEARLLLDAIVILEDGEGPRWRFHYDRWQHDRQPDVLLLGSYRHPNTGNNLVGGINLNYLSKEQRDNLARALPQIMAAGNLYHRYHTGKRLLPDIFDNSYRTYNAEHIRGVTKDVMYPKYGLVQTAKNWLKKTVGGIFKSREQRKKDAAPKYPSDLSQMQDTLDQAVIQLQQNPPESEPPDTPEMQAARQNFLQFRQQQQMGHDQLAQQERTPMRRELQDRQQQQDADPQVKQQRQPQPQDPQMDMAQSFEREKQENQRELANPNNEIDLDNPELEEAIVYFSPLAGGYIIEPAYLPGIK